MAGQGAPLRPLVSVELARGVCAEIPLFFYAAEIAAAKMLLFFRKSVAMVFFTIRVYERKGSFGTAVAPLHQPVLQL